MIPLYVIISLCLSSLINGILKTIKIIKTLKKIWAAFTLIHCSEISIITQLLLDKTQKSRIIYII